MEREGELKLVVWVCVVVVVVVYGWVVWVWGLGIFGSRGGFLLLVKFSGGETR